MISGITPAQQALIPLYKAKYAAIGLSTGPTDRLKAIQACKDLANLSKRKPTRFIELIVESPESIEAYHKMETKPGELALIAGKRSLIKELIVSSGGDLASSQVLAQHAAATPAFYKFLVDVLRVDQFNKPEEMVAEKAQALHDFSEFCGLVYDFQNALFICDKPLAHGELIDGKRIVTWG